MKCISFIAPLFLLSVITGCGNGSSEITVTKTEDAVAAPIAAPVTTSTNTTTTTTTAATNKAATTPAVTSSNKTVTIGSQQPVTTTTAIAGLNPEHGKPGHRCDIAVGAPLDSKPNPVAITNTQPGTTISSPVINTTSPSKTNTVTTGLNPEHGKPGHRCDIAVGAPLNSQPKQ